MSEISTNEERLPERKAETLPQITPMAMLQTAVEKGAGLEQLEKLMGLQERWEANEARKAYVAAMNAFKADPPELFKTRYVEYETKSGKTEYYHATLDHIANKISEYMAPHGLSFRWNTDQQESRIKVTCVVAHELGHSESVTLQASPDESGGKNSIQAIGSTVSYLERYTLLAATGLATKGMDNDGAMPVDTITDEQAKEIRSLLEKIPEDVGMETRTLNYAGVGSIEEIPLLQYETVVEILKQWADKYTDKGGDDNGE